MSNLPLILGGVAVGFFLLNNKKKTVTKTTPSVKPNNKTETFPENIEKNVEKDDEENKQEDVDEKPGDPNPNYDSVMSFTIPSQYEKILTRVNKNKKAPLFLVLSDGSEFANKFKTSKLFSDHIYSKANVVFTEGNDHWFIDLIDCEGANEDNKYCKNSSKLIPIDSFVKSCNEHKEYWPQSTVDWRFENDQIFQSQLYVAKLISNIQKQINFSDIYIFGLNSGAYVSYALAATNIAKKVLVYNGLLPVNYPYNKKTSSKIISVFNEADLNVNCGILELPASKDYLTAAKSTFESFKQNPNDFLLVNNNSYDYTINNIIANLIQ